MDSTIRNALALSESLEHFFGCNLSKVDQRLLKIGLDGPPEWLRGISRISELPRFRFGIGGTRFQISHLSPAELAERIIWIVETLGDRWDLGRKNVQFYDLQDIIYYRLKFD